MREFRNVHDWVGSLPLAPYCIVAGIVAAAGSAVLVTSALVIAELAGVSPPYVNPGEMLSWTDLLGAIVLAPILETMLLIALLRLIEKIGLKGWRACVASAFVWGVLHGMLGPWRFFGSIWSFFVFGMGYVSWRRRSRWAGFMAAAVPHAVVNGIALTSLRAFA